jgi:hypothetical protein
MLRARLKPLPEQRPAHTKYVSDARELSAENGDLATAFLSLERIAADLRRVQERLERTADAAEADNQRLAEASLSGQQLVRAKLGAASGETERCAIYLTERIEGTAFDNFDDRQILGILAFDGAGRGIDPQAPEEPEKPGDLSEDSGEFDEEI